LGRFVVLTCSFDSSHVWCPGLAPESVLEAGGWLSSKDWPRFRSGRSGYFRAVWGFLTIYTFNPFLLPRSGRFFYGAVLCLAGVPRVRAIEKSFRSS
jgi:hypothetical protein